MKSGWVIFTPMMCVKTLHHGVVLTDYFESVVRNASESASRILTMSESCDALQERQLIRRCQAPS